MPDNTVPKSLRVSLSEWQALRDLRRELEERSPYGSAVTLRDAFRVAVGSTASISTIGQCGRRGMAATSSG